MHNLSYFDVVFISNGEGNADENFARLAERLQYHKHRAKLHRVDRVKGIHAAHKRAAEVSTTAHFFTVDADNWVIDDFDFMIDFAIDESSVYVWRCQNSVNGLVYGYGAIKLFPTALVKAMPTNTVDMTTSVSLNYRIVNRMASVTRFNTSAFEAWKSGFREAVKLSSKTIDRQRDEETEVRLNAWCTRGNTRPFGRECIAGAVQGRAYGQRHQGDKTALAKINDFQWLEERFDQQPSEPMTGSIDNTAAVLRLVELISPTPLVKNLRQTMAKFPDANWQDALSWGQLKSKLWLIDELSKLDRDLGCVYVLGGWIGTLPALMFNNPSLRIATMRSFDIDATCAPIADSLNKEPYVLDNWRFKATTADMLALAYENDITTTLRNDSTPVAMTSTPDTIINTSCDHIQPFDAWWARVPKGKLVVVQNNDFFGVDDDHVNNVNTLSEFAQQTPLTTILYEGELVLPEYSRFMRIGIK